MNSLVVGESGIVSNMGSTVPYTERGGVVTWEIDRYLNDQRVIFLPPLQFRVGTHLLHVPHIGVRMPGCR